MTTNQKTVELAISGMSCGSCVWHVTEALRGVAGVGDVAVDLKGGRATVSCDPSLASAAELVHVVEEAGYEAAVLPAESH
jgi:copper chaperone CopZ